MARPRRWLRTAATTLNWLVAAAWVYRTADIVRNLPRVPNLNAPEWGGAFPPLAEGVKLAVIVPACNEEDAIERTVRSLLAQEGVALEVVAVDDRSTDRTGAILDALAAEAVGSAIPLKVLHIHELPAGWMGKQHALASGVAQTEAPYFLFTDGDVFFRPDALRRAMLYAVSEQADHLVLLPTPIIRSFGEHMMLAAMQMYSAGVVRLWKVADPDAKDRLGVGAFNLLRRDAYEAIGGFEALRMEVLEDVRLAVEIKRRRLRQRLVFGRDLATLHWAAGVAGIVRSITKNLFAAFRFNTPVALGTCAALSAIGIYPTLCLVGPPAMRAASVVSIASTCALYFAFRREGGSSPLYALTLPAATAILIYATLRSVAVTLARGAVVWRGTAYPLAELRRSSGPLL